MSAQIPTLSLAPALVVLPGPRAGYADGAPSQPGETGGRPLRAPDARDLLEHGPVLVAHAAMTAKRLNLHAPSRSQGLFDVLELYAFVRPATFCAPSAVGLAMALGLPEPKGAPAQAASLRDSAAALLSELALTPQPSREEALAVAETLARGGWAWGPPVIGALRSVPVGNQFRSSGLDVWARALEWEDQAPLGEPGSRPIDPEAAAERLAGHVLDTPCVESKTLGQIVGAQESAEHLVAHLHEAPRLRIALSPPSRQPSTTSRATQVVQKKKLTK